MRTEASESPLLPHMPGTKAVSEREVDPLISSDGAVKGILEVATPAATAALVKRLDLFILAPLALLYLICYLDRSNLANAKTEISASLSLSTEQYSLASSLFQVSLWCLAVAPSLKVCHFCTMRVSTGWLYCV